MSLPLRAVAWDIDGTLIDSEPLHDSVLVEICAAYGADISDLPENYFRGIHMPDVWKALQSRFSADLTEAEWLAAMVNRYIERAGELKPLQGAIAAVDAFAKAGLRQVCVSNSGRRIVDANLKALGILDRLDFTISLDDVTAGKPDPIPYLSAAQRLGIPAAAIAAVEDSVAGATSAREAGMLVFGIAPVEGLPLGPAQITINRLHELPDLILSPASLPA